MKKAGKIETGTVFEQYVEIENPDGTGLRLRCIELQPDTPTESGDEHVRLLKRCRSIPSRRISARFRPILRAKILNRIRDMLPVFPHNLGSKSYQAARSGN